MRDRLYLAGPMGGIPGLNFKSFNAAAKRLRKSGWEVFNPAEAGFQPKKRDRGNLWRFFMSKDINALLACQHVVVLPGWERSKGARLEVHIARELGMEVFDYVPLPTGGAGLGLIIEVKAKKPRKPR